MRLVHSSGLNSGIFAAILFRYQVRFLSFIVSLRMKTLAIIFTIVPSLLFGQGISSSSSHLLIPLDARSAALGQAIVSHEGHGTAITVNPASSASLLHTEITLSHNAWIQGVSTQSLSALTPISIGVFSFSISAASVRDIQLRTKPGPPTDLFASRALNFSATLARELTSRVFVGTSIRYLYEKILVDEATGYAIDIGGIYRTPVEGLAAGVSFAHIGSMSAFRQERGELPIRLQLGASYRVKIDEWYTLLSIDFEQRRRVSFLRAIISAELIYSDFLSVRLGYRSNDGRHLSFGAGILFEFLNFDYAYVPFSYTLGDAHIVTLRFLF
jgi:hypothetical protein